MKTLFRVLCIFLLTFSLVTGCDNNEIPGDPVETTIINGRYIEDIYTNKGMYDPSDRVTISLNLYNPEITDFNGNLKILVRHLDREINQIDDVFTLEPNERGELKAAFITPKTDFTGYSIEAYIYNSENDLVDFRMTAVDVSSDWSVFPRYGYLADSFGSSSYNESRRVISDLTKYHINGLFYFDVIDQHDKPLAGSVENPDQGFENLARKNIKRETLQNLIEIGHNANMNSYVYNLIFGAYDNYQDIGIDPLWGIYLNQELTNQDYHPLPQNWETSRLHLFDPGNTKWQDHYLKVHADFLAVYNFDGIQADSLGGRPTLYTAESVEKEYQYDLSRQYSVLLNRMYDELNTRVIFNAVSEYGQDDVIENFPNYDITFAEVWQWSHPTYASIKRVIDNYYDVTKGEKGVVIPAYMHNETAAHNKYFNEAGVRFLNSVITAAGGSHLEIGDVGMLCTPYYADRYLQMTFSLEKATRNIYSYMTAYQNLLRGQGLKEVQRRTIINDKHTSLTGQVGSVWSFTKEKIESNQEILHLINFTTIDNLEWVDNELEKPKPTILEDLVVKHYTENVEKVLFASPDYRQGIMESLDFTVASDDNGEYVEFSLPQLEYYSMVVFER